MLEYITIEPEQSANACIIWLHGLGADGHDFVDIAGALALPPELAVRFIFPHAKMMPVTLNQGYVMRAWFDILDVAIDGRRDTAGIYKAILEVNQLIEQQLQLGIKPERLLLAGFSQGAATVLMTGLTHPQKIAGMIALSGFLPDTDLLTKAIVHTRPCFLAHGTQDQVVPLALGEQSAGDLQQAGFPVTWHTYLMAHQVCPEEIADLGTWITQVLR